MFQNKTDFVTNGQKDFINRKRVYKSPVVTMNITDSLWLADENEKEKVPLSDEPLYEASLHLIVFLSICFGSISVAAVIGNGLVMWIIATSRRMKSVTNYYIANLALADILIAIWSIPFEVTTCIFCSPASLF